jgi:hypothetical protein
LVQHIYGPWYRSVRRGDRMTLVVIVLLTVFIASFVTVAPFLDFVCCSASRYWEISLVSAVGPKSGTL